VGNFSFSGLKTQVLYFIGKMETEDEHFIKNNLAVNYGIESYIPSFEFCTDNAAMLAMSGLFKYQKQDFADFSVKAIARF